MKIVGISLDDVASQKKFAEGQKLTYPLISDPDGSAAVAYGAALPGSSYAKRITFVIDPEGVIRHVDKKVDVAKHGNALTALIKRLQGENATR